MPIYVYQCEKCGNKLEVVQNLGGVPMLCCGKAMDRVPTSHSMVKWTGEGGFPTMRKAYKRGTAPNTRGYSDVPID